MNSLVMITGATRRSTQPGRHGHGALPGWPAYHRILHSSIEVQGWIGQLTTLNTGRVATQALDAALKGPAICIPGWPNRVVQVLASLLPATWAAYLVGIRWRSAQQRHRVVLQKSGI